MNRWDSNPRYLLVLSESLCHSVPFINLVVVDGIEPSRCPAPVQDYNLPPLNQYRTHNLIWQKAVVSNHIPFGTNDLAGRSNHHHALLSKFGGRIRNRTLNVSVSTRFQVWVISIDRILPKRQLIVNGTFVLPHLTIGGG